MKKNYKQPLMEVVRIASAGMLATSSDVDDSSASHPARAAWYDDEED